VYQQEKNVLNRRTFTAALVAAAIAGSARALEVADDDAIRDILRHRVDVEKRAIGMAACVVTPNRKRFVSWGRERSGDNQPVTFETVFEIASITKVFTALLLADMALRGEVGLDDPVARHLPADFNVPNLDGREITLTDLATHTAGLPWWPPFPGAPQSDDAAFIAFLMTAVPRLSVDAFRLWLAGFHLESKPGTTWAYGNTGYALLSMALAHRAGRSYESILQKRVIEPLDLKDTAFHPTAAMTPRLAETRADIGPKPLRIDLGIFAAAGGLRSTPRDMSRFATAILPGSGSRLAPAAQLLLSVRRPAPPILGVQSLGWEVREAPGGAFVSKDGVSWGQSASMVFDPEKRLAIVTFSNALPELRFAKYSGGGVGAADLAQHLLRPQIPLGGQGGATY
jgi:D-alanyl-D-alanine-carboxypeptidase/D-alanyl-D-alanine-endopeptidase